MRINFNTGRVQSRVHGVDRTIRNLAYNNQNVLRAAQEGCVMAARHLKFKIQAKFGKYQQGWAPLSIAYRFRKLAKYGTTGKPLIAEGKMQSSFYIREPQNKRITASVASDDPKLRFHVSPGTGSPVPKRDPVFPTVEEEEDAMHKIIRRRVGRAVNGRG